MSQPQQNKAHLQESSPHNENHTVDTAPPKLEAGVSRSDIPSSAQNDPITDDESKYITGPKLILINAGLMISIFLVQMESSIISTAIVDITNQLGGYEKSSWLFTAYLLTYCGKPYYPFSSI